MQKPIIGILAGMGPKSTAPFINAVINQCEELLNAKNDIDFPPMIIYSLPTPFYINQNIDHELMKNTICEGLKKLESCGVSFIAMPCNTAHIYFEKLKKCISIPLLNMIDITIKTITSSTKKIGILGTHLTINSKIFQKELDKTNLEYVENPNWQILVDELILKIKTEKNIMQLKNLWEKLSNDLLKDQIDTLLIVCSDLSIIKNEFEQKFQTIDSSICLANETVKKWHIIK
jgi:aspartate racemase